MTWRNIRLILLREVRDQLRDRRTLFMVLVLPLLLYPGLGVGMLQMAMYFTEQPRVVVVLGADELPELPLIEDGRIAPRWFRLSDHAQRLVVVTDSDRIKDSIASGIPGAEALNREELLDAARRIRELALQRNSLAEKLAPWDEKIAAEATWIALPQEASATSTPPKNLAALQNYYREVKQQLASAFTDSKLQVLVVVPEHFGRNLTEVDRLLSAKDFSSQRLHELPLLRPLIVRNRASDKSDVAYRYVREALDEWEQELLARRLQAAQLPDTVPQPVNPISLDVAGEEEIAANVWSKVFPSLLVIMALTGAFYPAIDVAAGEKERGTMETLLICPATRSEIVMGKFLTVLIFSMATTVLNLISMGSTSRYIVSVTQAAAAPSNLGSIPLPTPLAIFWLFVLLVPLAALFSALCLALATFARSNKEGQYYLTPLFMVTLGLTMFSMSPSIELSAAAGASLFYCTMPIVGPALLLKSLLMNPGDADILVFALPVLMSSIGYSLLALWWAVEQFKSEDVLFREAERFDLRLWLRHLLRDKESMPSASEAAACFVLMLLLQFLSISMLGQGLVGVKPEDMGTRVMQLAVIQQIALIGSPALFMAILLTSSARRTLKLSRPKWRYLGLALVLPVVLHPLAIELLASLHRFFPQLPDSARQAFAAMSDPNTPLIVILAAFALTPALCEELAFRGFILSGISRGGRTGVAIALSAITFGIIHMIPQQVFNATLLGFVLGLLAVRSGSLWPSVLFHFCFNSLAVFHKQAHELWSKSISSDSKALRFFISSDGNDIRYEIGTLVLCSIAAYMLIRWLLRTPTELPAQHRSSRHHSLAAEIGGSNHRDGPDPENAAHSKTATLPSRYV